MPADQEQPRAPVPGAGGSDEERPRLDRPVQEHLGQQLRTTYHALADKPAFLGDPALPTEFDPHIQRLEARERVHARGIEAVRTALEGAEAVRAALADLQGGPARDEAARPPDGDDERDGPPPPGAAPRSGGG